jgi:hypothetical protein
MRGSAKVITMIGCDLIQTIDSFGYWVIRTPEAIGSFIRKRSNNGE